MMLLQNLAVGLAAGLAGMSILFAFMHVDDARRWYTKLLVLVWFPPVLIGCGALIRWGLG